MTSHDLYYTLFPSEFGILGIMWRQPESGVRVTRIFLPFDHQRLKALIARLYPHSIPGFCFPVDTLGKSIVYSLKGVPFSFPFGCLDITPCSPFQQQVLRAIYQVPRGRITTYGHIASHLKPPGAARAVGRALSHNPFPFVVPCHRVIRSSGDIGGFGGEFPGFSLGGKLKQILLKLEGIPVSSKGRVPHASAYDHFLRD